MITEAAYSERLDQDKTLLEPIMQEEATNVLSQLADLELVQGCW